MLTRRIQSHILRLTRDFHATPNAWARILASDPVHQICADVFKSRGHNIEYKVGLPKEELLKIVGEYDGLVVRSETKVTKEVIEAAPNLKLIGRAGTGVDNIDVTAATRKGILVLNTPGGNTISTAELTLSHILALARNIPQAVASLKEGRWDRSKYTGTELSGKVLGVIGLGRIGREVASWCQAFGMHTIGYDPILSASSARQAGIDPVSLDEIFARADFITVHTPLTKDTRYLLNRDTLAKCKRGVRIINCARGGIVDEAALLEALNSGHAAGAAFDVFESEPPSAISQELSLHPHVIATPHLGASTKDAQVRVARDIALHMCDALEGRDYQGVINAPNMDFARRSQLLPFVRLAEKIGSLHAQLLGSNKVHRIYVTLLGKDLAVPEMSEALRCAVLKGALSSLLDQEVNFINAIPLADEMGLALQASLVENTDSHYANTLSVEFEMEGILNAHRSITGTVFGQNDLRIIDVDGYQMDVVPSGTFVMFNNRDRPGVLKAVSSRLAADSVNIRDFSVGRKTKGTNAIGIVTLDDEITEECLTDLSKLEMISNVMQIKLLDMPDKVFRVMEQTPAPAAAGSKPTTRPLSPEFGSGPCKKRPGYNLRLLSQDTLGRSHRSKLGKGKLKMAIDETKRILGIPDDYLVGIVPASDTGAFEMAMWHMLGERPVDVAYWESFGKGWLNDIQNHLKLPNVRSFKADYGKIPDLSQLNFDNDVIFTWNGTTSGVKVPNGNFIAANRTGLTFNDATSAAFAMDIPWDKVDVTTFSWQKVLGGEGAHGMMVLSPRAVERLESYTPPNRPLPKIFRLLDKAGKVDRSIFEGSTINTPSMLCVEDYLDALSWADSLGGVAGIQQRSRANLAVLERFAAENPWLRFLVEDQSIRSWTSVCFTLDLNKDQVKTFTSLLEKEKVAYDIGSYRDAPAGLRIWCGATIEKSDLEALLPWLKWAYETSKK